MKRNHWLIVSLRRSFLLLIILLLSGKILAISFAVNQWSSKMVRVCESPVLEQSKCSVEIDVV